MKETKFRGWNELDDKMIDMGDLCFVHIGSYSSFLIDILNGTNEHIKLMQYIGLKDKNKKEIYEGDIVYLFGCEKATEIVFKNGAFGYYGTIHGDFIAIAENSNFNFNNLEIEIIGNKYKNKELLK